MNDEDALNEDEEVDDLMEYFEEPLRRSSPKTFLWWIRILKNECDWDVWEEGYANAWILYYQQHYEIAGKFAYERKMADTDMT